MFTRPAKFFYGLSSSTATTAWKENRFEDVAKTRAVRRVWQTRESRSHEKCNRRVRPSRVPVAAGKKLGAKDQCAEETRREERVTRVLLPSLPLALIFSSTRRIARRAIQNALQRIIGLIYRRARGREYKLTRAYPKTDHPLMAQLLTSFPSI